MGYQRIRYRKQKQYNGGSGKRFQKKQRRQHTLGGWEHLDLPASILTNRIIRKQEY